ncbi:MAG: ABC transporter substrate-binding protein [Corynebacterium sp.]|nr:ABC transporter substrate-binding protein [Corynebacterium sp.]
MGSTRRISSWHGLVALGTTLVLILSACSSNDEEADNSLNYVVNAELVTTNAGSAVGFSTDAALLTDRLYPAAYINGPKGQVIPNPDFIDAHSLPGVQQSAVFEIADQTKFSDGVPLTCDSFVLAYAASKLDAFHSFLPMMSQVSEVRCASGSKKAEVYYHEGFGDRWRQTFAAGTLLPAHAIAARMDISLERLTQALQNPEEDPELVQVAADIWNNGFNLSNFDPALQVASGPYKIASVGNSGEVYLTRNEYYVGSAAEIGDIVVWPASADTTKLGEDRRIAVAEAAAVAKTNWVNRDDSYNPYNVEPVAGILAEQLLLSTNGVFSDPEMRRAFSACIDQRTIAEISSDISGVDVAPSSVRTVRLNDPLANRLGELTESHLNVDIEAAKALEGREINIGYLAPNERYAAMVRNIQETCEPAGITINDVSRDDASISGLSRTEAAGDGVPITVGDDSQEIPIFDAFINSIDPEQAFSGLAKTTQDIDAARVAELDSWEQMSTIPLAAQPRIFITRNDVSNLAVNSTKAGIGWNLDRWEVADTEQ